MKIAIHHRNGSFSDQWINYCKNKQYNYLIVNVFESDIVRFLLSEGVTHFMWHINHASYKDLMAFHYVMNSLEQSGINCYPNFKTRWHFDDKIAQKYLLEGVRAPLVPSFVFYDRTEALNHLTTADFPLVAKLRRGAGASNVKLLRTSNETAEYINKLFTKGINSMSGALGNLDQKYRLAKKIDNPFVLIRKTISFLRKNKTEKKLNLIEKGYFYYQKFIPGNDFDIRLIVIANKYAYGLRRLNRPNDFRASGSSNFRYDQIPLEVVAIAFETTTKLQMQACAFDFVFDENNRPLIVEMSFGFGTTGSSKAPGFWTKDLEWHQQEFNPQDWMMDDFVTSI